MNDLQKIARQLRKPSGEFGEKVAEKMDDGNRPLYDLVLETINLDKGQTILEIGFGGGGHFEDLLMSNQQITVYGVDYSEKMVAMAKERNHHFLEAGSLVLNSGNSKQLPYSDRQFDKVFCNMVIYFWDIPELHLQEIHRVLKPQGQFLTGMRTRDSMMMLPFTKYGFRLYGTDEWSGILVKNGFVVKDIKGSTDPPIEEKGENIQLESRCVVAEKQ